MARLAADPVVELGLVRNPPPVPHAVLALALLLAATLSAIDEPFGLTQCGARRQMRTRASVHALRPAPGDASAEGLPRRWENLVWIAGLAIPALVIVFHPLGSDARAH